MVYVINISFRFLMQICTHHFRLNAGKCARTWQKLTAQRNPTGLVVHSQRMVNIPVVFLMLKKSLRPERQIKSSVYVYFDLVEIQLFLYIATMSKCQLPLSERILLLLKTLQTKRKHGILNNCTLENVNIRALQYSSSKNDKWLLILQFSTS